MEKNTYFRTPEPRHRYNLFSHCVRRLKNKLGFNTEPVRLGQVNEETKYALDYFKKESPRLVETAANEVNGVILLTITNASKASRILKTFKFLRSSTITALPILKQANPFTTERSLSDVRQPF